MVQRTHRPRPHNPMPESPYEVLALFTAAMVGSSLWLVSTGCMLPFFIAGLHIGQSEAGLILSIQLIGSVAMTSVAGMLTDRFGDRRIVLWSGLVMGAALLIAAVAQNYAWLLGWLLIYGIGYAAVTPAGSHAIIYFFRKADRGFAMGIRQCGVPIAGALGSLLLPLTATRFEYRGALALAGLLTLIACAGASAFYREPEELRGRRASILALISEMIGFSREARLILLSLTSVVLSFGQFAFLAFFTLTLVHRLGYSVGVAVGLFTVAQLAAAAGRLSWGWMSDRWFGGSRALPLALNCLLVALAGFVFAALNFGTPVWAATLVALAFGFTAEGWFGLSIIGFAEIGGEEHSGSALGVGLTWTLAAGFITPALFGAIIQTVGYATAWRYYGIFEAVGVIPALLASRAIARAAPERSAS
ncbi:MAG: MFS transporter [Candidatus Eremiobacteraeota bacterium]|nr:MFS transporter [Candidatus Eremiobacteraeota bacterium]